MPLPVSGGSHALGESHGHGGDHGHADNWPDLTRKEALTLFPLAVATIVFGVLPGLVFRYCEPAFERILAMYR